MVVEPEHDRLPGVRRDIEGDQGPGARVRADVEDGGERRAGAASDLHLDLVVGERVRAVRLVPEAQRWSAARDRDRLRERAVAVDCARRADARRVAARVSARADDWGEGAARAPAAQVAGLEAPVDEALRR